MDPKKWLVQFLKPGLPGLYCVYQVKNSFINMCTTIYTMYYIGCMYVTLIPLHGIDREKRIKIYWGPRQKWWRKKILGRFRKIFFFSGLNSPSKTPYWSSFFERMIFGDFTTNFIFSIKLHVCPLCQRQLILFTSSFVL